MLVVFKGIFGSIKKAKILSLVRLGVVVSIRFLIRGEL